MADEQPEGQQQNQQQGQQGAAQLSVLTQYVRDLSFENPNAPGSLTQENAGGNPNIDVNVDIQARRGADDRYEVILKTRIDARNQDGKAMFLCELDYAGLFVITGVPQESLEPVLLIECPRLLFPFARRVIGDVTRDGGFPPLNMDPIDFAGLYRARVAQAQAQQEGSKEGGDDPLSGPAQGNA